MPHRNSQSTSVESPTTSTNIEPCETTPLNKNNSSGNMENPSQSQELSSRPHMDAVTKRVLIKIAIDFILICCVGFPILFYFLYGSAYERGFFCDDESLMHPFHESTVTHNILYAIGFGIPLLSVVITELLRWRQSMDNERELKLFGRDIPFWVQNVYKYFGIFLFGAACSQLTTDIGKYSIGRLRPHFLSVCQPIMPDGTNCSHPLNQNRYIEEFTCGNKESSARRIKEMRLSFPSGHSSFSMYTMVFAALYLQCRMSWKGSKLFKHFLQFLFVSIAWYTALSRISDYKHHWSDVLSGSLQGLIVCLLIVFGISDLFSKRIKRSLPMTRYELNSQNTNGNSN
ncbi:CLUMA_CG016170, isoform A [Clunio marinus]|uniref:CLUMA_CG016170, isoform A n=1 Tax=Clunio marinus TaxID=568069 RepID=A0A1J1ISA8_9DIPT|nr:CLUMA_CG016170, isoform A [Clunio marinus]